MDTKALGLSKKTNIAIAAIVTINMAKESPWAILAIVVVALFAGTCQFIIDRKE